MKLGMEVGVGPGHITLTVLTLCPQLPLPKGAQPPIFGLYLLCQTAGWIKMPLGRQVGCVRWEDRSPHFLAHVLWPNGWMDQDVTWYTDTPRPRTHCYTRTQLPPKGAQPPSRRQFSAHVCCGQTAGLIKLPLGMEAGLGPGHIVLDGGPSSP